MNLYGFAGGDPINHSDPFGLAACPPDCPDNSDGLGWARYAGALLKPIERPLEIAGTVVAGLPLAGLGGGISAEVMQLGNTLRSGAGSGILTAAGVAGRVANATGGTVSALARSDGFRVTVDATRTNIVARIKASGEMRVGIDRYGALTRDGSISSDRAATHLRNLSSDDLIALINKGRQAVSVPR